MNSRFMPVEHQGIEPEALVLNFHPTDVIEPPTSKSALFNKVEIPNTPDAGHEDYLVIQSQIEDAQGQILQNQQKRQKSLKFV